MSTKLRANGYCGVTLGCEGMILMTLHQLRIFLTVAQSSTLTRASKQLGLAQPSLSKQLAGLEDSVGTRLFDRGHNGMVLPDALMRCGSSSGLEVDIQEAAPGEVLEMLYSRQVHIGLIAADSVAQASV